MRDKHLDRAEKILRDMRHFEGGSLRLKAFQVCDVMHDLIASLEEEARRSRDENRDGLPEALTE